MDQARLVTSFPQYPQYQVLVTIFENVTNTSALRNELLAGNTDYEYAFVSTSTVSPICLCFATIKANENITKVYSIEHLLAGVYRAITDSEAGFLRTRNLHSEIIFCLSPNNNVSSF